MIKVYENATGLTEIELEITKYINKNLETIICVAIEFIENSDGEINMDDFVPRYFFEHKIAERNNLIYELKDIISSNYIRDYMKPKYEYLLYHILLWWEAVVDEEEDLLPNKLSREFESVLVNNGENDWLNLIINFNSYYEICFEDHDFLPGSLNNLVGLFIDGKGSTVKNMFHVDLDDYIDCMQTDLRELYLDYRKDHEQSKSVNNLVIVELLNALTHLEQRVVNLVKREEVELSDDIHAYVKRTFENNALTIEREATIGRAEVKLGETDLYIYNYIKGSRQDIAIVEIKLIEKFKEQYKQLLGYLNPNFDYGITISINKNKTLHDALDYIKNNLTDIETEYGNFKIIKTITSNKSPYFLISEHYLPELPNKTMKIFHMILNLSDNARKEIAKLARAKSSKKTSCKEA